MKKMLIAIIVAVLLFPAIGLAAENYFLARYGHSLENDSYENYYVFENRSLKDWAFGAKIVALPDGITILNPQIFWTGLDSLHFGIKYCHTSTGSDSTGPTVRFVKATDYVFMIWDTAYYFDLHSDFDKIDSWLHVSTPGLGWYAGFEIWFYEYRHQPEVFKLRPLKVGYRSSRFPSPFLMIERKWTNWEDGENVLFGGLELKF